LNLSRYIVTVEDQPESLSPPTMQFSLSAFASLILIGSVTAKQNGDSSVTRAARAKHSFLGKATRLQPGVVAHTLSRVEEDWKDMAIAFAECNQTSAELSDVDCSRAPNAFQKSCSTVVNSVFQASTGDRDIVQQYMSEVCEQDELKGWKQDHCRSFASNLVNSMSLDVFENRQHLKGSDLCKKFWFEFQLEEQAELEKQRTQQEATEQNEAEARAEAAKIAAAKHVAAEKERIKQEAIANRQARAVAKAGRHTAAARAKALRKEVEKSKAAENHSIAQATTAKKHSNVKKEKGTAVDKARVENKTAVRKGGAVSQKKITGASPRNISGAAKPSNKSSH